MTPDTSNSGLRGNKAAEEFLEQEFPRDVQHLLDTIHWSSKQMEEWWRNRHAQLLVVLLRCGLSFDDANDRLAVYSAEIHLSAAETACDIRVAMQQIGTGQITMN